MSEVIDNGQTMMVSSLFEMYKSEFVANGGVIEDFESYTPQALMRKVQDRFKDGILTALLDVRRGNFLYSSRATEDVARQRLQDDSEKRQLTFRSTALYLRNQILEMPK